MLSSLILAGPSRSHACFAGKGGASAVRLDTLYMTLFLQSLFSCNINLWKNSAILRYSDPYYSSSRHNTMIYTKKHLHNRMSRANILSLQDDQLTYSFKSDPYSISAKQPKEDVLTWKSLKEHATLFENRLIHYIMY